MKNRDFILISVGLALLWAVWIWLTPPPAPADAVTLSVVKNLPGGSTNEVIFRLQNAGPRAIFLSRMFVEGKTPNGWLLLDEITPADSRVIAGGKSKNLPVNIPSGGEPWRLRVACGDEAGGAGLFLTKLFFAIQEHKFPGNGFGAFAGSNSLSSAEIPR